MTLRVTFTIVPFGEEAAKYDIAQLNIHNGKDHGFGHCEYYGSLTEIDYKKDITEYKFEGIQHSRKDGYAVLVEKVLNKLEEIKHNQENPDCL